MDESPKSRDRIERCRRLDGVMPASTSDTAESLPGDFRRLI